MLKPAIFGRDVKMANRATTKCRRAGKLAATASLAAIAAAYSFEAAAQVDTITVTARKTEESVQKVPVAVSVVDTQLLESAGVTDVAGIASFAPNVTLDATAPISGSSSVLVSYIRGVGQSDFAFNFEPGVGIYVDGVYLARNVGANADLLDVQRIEVLKGPQGTLFGRNSIGGAISIVSKKPTDEFDAKIEMTTGRFSRLDVRGVISGPITDNLNASLAFSSKNRDGYVTRIPFLDATPADQADFRAIDGGVLDDLPNGNDLGNQNSDTMRLQLVWEPTDRFDAHLRADYTRTRENSAPTILVDAELGGLSGLYNACVAGMGPPACGAITNGLTGDVIDPMFTDRTPYDNRFLTGGDLTTYGNSISGTKLDSMGVALDLNYSLTDSITIKSISAYRRLDSIFGEDADMSPLIIDHHGFELDQEQFSEEIQFAGLTGPLKWLVGFYYFHEEGVNNDYVPLGGGLFQVYGLNDLATDSLAVFGQGTYNVTDKLSATFGIRYTDDEREFIGRQRDLNDLSSQLGAPLAAFPDPTDTTLLHPPGKNTLAFEDVSIRASLEYAFTDDVFTYASYAEGFKAGGWDTRLTGPELVAVDFEEETATTYEAGVKSQSFGNTLQINLAGFYTEYENLQLVIQRGISPLTANAGKSDIKGIEAEFIWAPNPDFQLSGNYGWTDAKYTELDANANAVGIFLDNEFNNTPKHQFSIAADYTHQFASGSLAYNISYSWVDDHFNDAVNTSELRQEAFGLLGLSATYDSPDNNWYISAGATNLTDERYVYSGFNQPGVGYIISTIGRPREWFMRVGANL